MPVKQVLAIVNGYLHNMEIQFGTAEDKSSFRVLLGSTGVYIGTYEQEGTTIVQFKAIVLTDVSEESPIAILPVINGDIPLANFCFYPDDKLVTLEYEVLGDTLDEEEFRAGLTAVAEIADGWDDRLQTEFDFGGTRHTEEDPSAPDREI